MARDHEELLFHGQSDLDGAFDEKRQRGHERFELDVELAAEPAAEMRNLDAHAVLGPAEKPGDLDTDERRILRGRVQRQPTVRRIADGDERLHGRVHALLRLERVLENMIRRCKSRLDIAAAKLVVERDIRTRPALQMFEIGKGRRRLQFVVDEDTGGHGVRFVVDGGQFLVIGRDQARGLFGHLRIGREHDGDRLAGEADLAVGEDRLIVKSGPIIGMRDDRTHVVDRDHAIHAFNRFGPRRVDPRQAGMRHRTSADLAVEHVGQAQVMDVIGAPHHLLASLQASKGPADVVARRQHLHVRHRRASPPARV